MARAVHTQASRDYMSSRVLTFHKSEATAMTQRP